jgi:transposase
MKPITNEKRELIIEGKQRGEKTQDIAKWLNVSLGSVGTIWTLYRKTGSYESKPYKGRVSVLNETNIKEISEAISQTPDITLEELIEELSLPIKKSQLSRLLISLGLYFKKRVPIRQGKIRKMFKKR